MEDSVLDLIADFVPPNPSRTDEVPAATPPATTRIAHFEEETSEDGGASTVGVRFPGLMDTREPSDESKADVHLICFSKNRAFQLDQFLTSAKRHLSAGADDTFRYGDNSQLDMKGELSPRKMRGSRTPNLRISVLYLVAEDDAELPIDDSVSPSTVYSSLGNDPATASSSQDSTRDNPFISSCREAPDNDQDETRAAMSANSHQVSEQKTASGMVGQSRGMKESYSLVSRRHPDVHFVPETPGKFCDQLHELVASCREAERREGQGRFVMFTVDDMFFFRDFELADATRLLRQDPTIYCVHLRLHPGITWSHTAGSPCKVPPLTHTEKTVVTTTEDESTRTAASATSIDECRLHQSSGQSLNSGIGSSVERHIDRRQQQQQSANFGVLTFNRGEGSGEWDYPWDLTGGLYRRKDALTVFQGIANCYGKGAAANPNLVEFSGNRLLRLPRGRETYQHQTLPSVPPTQPTKDAPSQEPVGNLAAVAAATAVADAPRCGCAGQAVVSSLAVNRVQSTYSTPVYASVDGSVADFNRRLWSTVVEADGIGIDVAKIKACGRERGNCIRERGGFDPSVYRTQAFNSVHVGELAFVSGHMGDGDAVAEAAQDEDVCAGVTVLLPVKNGGVHLLDAVASVISCCADSDDDGLGAVELLIIDDGSDDGAVGIAVAAASGQPIADAEPGAAEAAAATYAAAGACWLPGSATCDRFSIRVVRHDQSVGVAQSLNEGLKEAQHELIARMDADDVCLPDRLRRQAAFMQRNRNVSVLGSSVAIFSGDCLRNVKTVPARVRRQEQDELPPSPSSMPFTCQDRDQSGSQAPIEQPVCIPSSAVHRIVRQPTDSVFLAWSLFFGCCVAHPSVMLRRSAALDAGGYDQSAEPAEDYDLWLRLESKNPGCVKNIGEVLLGLRKHEKNVSRSRREDQATAAVASAARAMSNLLGRDIPVAQAAAVRTPEGTTDADELAEGARLLGDLEAALLRMAREACSQTMEYDNDNVKRASQLVQKDAEARLGAMAVHAMSRFGGGAAPVLEEWRKRYPGRSLLHAFTSL